MAIKALIFDFDGLILDTEGPEYETWRGIFEDHGCKLDFDAWTQCVGRSSHYYNPYVELEAQYGQPVDRDAVQAVKRARIRELIARETLLPGVLSYIDDAKRMGIKIGLASSSPRVWIDEHTGRFGMHAHFDAIKTADDVERAKPEPDLYLAALAALDVKPEEAIALEDSPNGVRAANSAGVFCVAVPNAITGRLDLNHADLQLKSLADLPLAELIEKANEKRKTI